MRRRRALLLCGYALPVVFVAFVTVASLVTPNYSQIANAVSDLGAQGRPDAIVARAGIVACGILMALFTLGISPLLRTRRRSITSFLLAASAFGVLAGIFQIYPSEPGAEHDFEGKLHNGFAVCMVLSLLVGMTLLAAAAREDSIWRPMFRPSIGLGIMALAFGGVVMFGPHRLQGIFQRGMFAAAFGWIVWVARRSLIIVTRKQDPAPRVPAIEPFSRITAAPLHRSASTRAARKESDDRRPG